MEFLKKFISPIFLMIFLIYGCLGSKPNYFIGGINDIPPLESSSKGKVVVKYKPSYNAKTFTDSSINLFLGRFRGSTGIIFVDSLNADWIDSCVREGVGNYKCNFSKPIIRPVGVCMAGRNNSMCFISKISETSFTVLTSLISDNTRVDADFIIEIRSRN